MILFFIIRDKLFAFEKIKRKYKKKRNCHSLFVPKDWCEEKKRVLSLSHSVHFRMPRLQSIMDGNDFQAKCQTHLNKFVLKMGKKKVGKEASFFPLKSSTERKRERRRETKQSDTELESLRLMKVRFVFELSRKRSMFFFEIFEKKNFTTKSFRFVLFTRKVCERKSVLRKKI